MDRIDLTIRNFIRKFTSINPCLSSRGKLWKKVQYRQVQWYICNIGNIGRVKKMKKNTLMGKDYDC